MNKNEELEKIKYDVLNLTSSPLYQDRVKNKYFPVIGQGNHDAEIMFIGEAGGYWEAKLRRPFVGNAGKLLDQLIKSIGLRRDEVYISNVVKTRPPNNRDPLFEEIEAFRPYLDQEIQIIKPKIIVTLGRFSMAKFLPGEYISQIHGQKRNIDFGGRKYIVIPMYHPAAALRNAKIMKELKEDFQKISKLVASQ